MRWHLAVLMKGGKHLQDIKLYESSLKLQDELIKHADELPEGDGTNRIPPFSPVEVRAIVQMGLYEYFEKELEDQVRLAQCP